MQAELKTIMSPDIADLETYQPQTDSFSLMLELEIGPRGSIETDLFYVEVISPKALAAQLETEPMLFGRALLIMKKFSYRRVKKFIENWCSGTHGKNWDEIMDKLTRYAGYEFLDYVK